MHSAMKAALQSGAATIFYAVKLVYPDFTLRLCNGGFIEIDGETYESSHPTYGALRRVDELTDGGEEEAQRWRVTLLPPSGSALTALTAPEAQESPIQAWWGVVDRATGVVVGDVDELFIGLTDQPDFSIGADRWEVTLDCCSGLDLALEAFEGLNLNQPTHDGLFPGEIGFDGVTGLDDPVWWGVARPPSAMPNGGTGFVGRAIDRNRMIV